MFFLQLAREMGMTAMELSERMTYWEFTQHVMSYRQNPWGDARADLHAALIACTVANTVPRKKGTPPFIITDFLLRMRQKQDVPKKIRGWVDQMARQGLVHEG